MVIFEQRNPPDIQKEEILPYLENFFGNSESLNINFFYHGTYNVFDIDSKYILRVPDRAFRNEKGLKMLTRERNFLDFLNNKLPLAIPKVLYFNYSEQIPFMVYEKIPGTSLVNVFSQLTDKQKQNLGIKIGNFLSTLHSQEFLDDYFDTYPKEKVNYKNAKTFIKKMKNQWIQNFKQAQKIVYPLISSEQQSWLNSIYFKYFNDSENFNFSPKIVHGDFDTSNILVDPKKIELTGIIDFEDCRVYDPAADLLFMDEGTIFWNAILNNYKFVTQSSLASRMKFLYCRTCVAYLDFGVLENRPMMIEEGLRMIDKNMKNYP